MRLKLYKQFGIFCFIPTIIMCLDKTLNGHREFGIMWLNRWFVVIWSEDN